MEKKLKKFAVQTRNIMRWERKQRRENIYLGLFYGIWLCVGALIIGVIIGYFL